MKICVSSTGKEKTSNIDVRFGRCQYFAIIDTEAGDCKFIDNAGITSAQGAGIAAAQQVIDEKVEAVITGNVGPNAINLLNDANIKIYKCSETTIEDAVKKFEGNDLISIDNPGPAHAGMKG